MNATTKLSKIIQFPSEQINYGNSIIVLIDLQNEYLSKGRAFSLGELKNCLANCRLILEQARAAGITIAHFKTVLNSAFFNPECPFSNWITDFSPQSNEMIFERNKPSIFSNKSFTNFIQHIQNPNLILLGLTGERGCLASAIEASHHNAHITFVKDASASSSLENLTEEENHSYISKLMKLYADVIETDNIISSINNIQMMRCP